MQWDKTYDTGNHDYGYAVTLSPDKQRIYIGGGAEVESGNQTWHEAVLLELDAGSGCPVGQYFESSGRGTTSAYYDIAVSEDSIYAVGEVQINPDKPEEPITAGGLVSIFSKEETISQDTCAADLIISDAAPVELTLPRKLIREGDTPTVAYSVALPPSSNCDGCEVLIGGASGANGWVDSLSADNNNLTSFKSIADMSVQDIAVQSDRVIFVGSSTSDDMLMLGYDRAGAQLWSSNPIEIGTGRLRGLAIDEGGFIYAVGSSKTNGSIGHLFKFDSSGNQVLHRQLGPQIDVSFSDLALFRYGGGVISGSIETEPNNFGGLRVNFDCQGTCNPNDE